MEIESQGRNLSWWELQLPHPIVTEVLVESARPHMEPFIMYCPLGTPP